MMASGAVSPKGEVAEVELEDLVALGLQLASSSQDRSPDVVTNVP
jgi:hypothetical protein